jgi:hypothetical protein
LVVSGSPDTGAINTAPLHIFFAILFATKTIPFNASQWIMEQGAGSQLAGPMDISSTGNQTCRLGR